MRNLGGLGPRYLKVDEFKREAEAAISIAAAG